MVKAVAVVLGNVITDESPPCSVIVFGKLIVLPVVIESVPGVRCKFPLDPVMPMIDNTPGVPAPELTIAPAASAAGSTH